MPEPDPSARPRIVADLRIDVSDDRGGSSAHLHDNADALVLEVDDAAAFLRQAHGLGRHRERAGRAVRDAIGSTPIHVRSHGRPLARLGVSSAGRFRVRPTVSGLTTVARHVASGSRARIVAGTAGPLLGLVIIVHQVRSRSGRRRRVSG